MRKIWSKIPLWLKITLGLLLLSVAGPFLAAFLIPFESWVFATVLLILAKYPGKDLSRPRIFKVLPWVYGLNAVTAALLLVALRTGQHWFDELGDKMPGQTEVILTLILTLPMLWLLLSKHRAFLPILVLSGLGEIFFDALRLSSAPWKTQGWLDFVGAILANGILVWYFFGRSHLFHSRLSAAA